MATVNDLVRSFLPWVGVVLISGVVLYWVGQLLNRRKND